MWIALPNFRRTILCTVLLLAACTNGPPPPPGWPGVTTNNDFNAPSYTAPSYVSEGCARSEDLRAVKTAVIKQRLMVAGYSCQAADSYNDFVRAYRRDLQDSDSDLQSFFYRLHGQEGDRALDSFKTRIANVSMSDRIADSGGYCADARARFNSAMSLRRKSLETFLASQTINTRERFAPCDMSTASNTR